ncbi:cytochrome c oxidase assembly protein [Oligella urethralis]|nr:cytochrome c oxidase assembly protein [Oligella urethralis]MDK6203206.1 cytochrome c oxidase assembly protein [Oligella urethralis]
MNLTLIQWLTPWHFSPTVLICLVVSAILFINGCRKKPINASRQMLFWSGWILLYLSMHTHVDYFAERVFFIHRVQHLVLHHLAPLMIMLAYPGQVMRAGMTRRMRLQLARFNRTALGQALIYCLTHKFFIPFLFVFLVIIWLFPTVQFYSMLNIKIYRFMNWSVVVSGLLYWNLILDRRPYHPPVITANSALGRWWQRRSLAGSPAVMSPLERVLSPVFTMAPQIVAGAYIAFSSTDLYPLFEICGRALPISAVQDQGWGGLIMWVPAGAVETFGILVAAMTWWRLHAQGRIYHDKRDLADARAQVKTV